MRIISLFLVLAASSSLAATAPDSVAGKVFHETGSMGAGDARANWQFSIILDATGHYRFVKFGYQSTLNLVPFGPFIGKPPADGTYTYARTGDTTATLTLNEPGGTLRWAYGPGSTDISPTAIALQLAFDSGSTGTDRTALFSTFALFDLDANLTAPAINASLRGTVVPGRSLIAGFVIPGSAENVGVARDILIRVVGPGLGQFGITGTWTAPAFRVVNSAFTVPAGSAQPGDWAQTTDTVAGFQKMFAVCGAFPLAASAKDAVTALRLAPGAYTVVCNPAAGDPGGEVLIEVYFLP